VAELLGFARAIGNERSHAAEAENWVRRVE
jgi:hypothetical protein